MAKSFVKRGPQCGRATGTTQNDSPSTKTSFDYIKPSSVPKRCQRSTTAAPGTAGRGTRRRAPPSTRSPVRRRRWAGARPLPEDPPGQAAGELGAGLAVRRGAKQGQKKGPQHQRKWGRSLLHGHDMGKTQNHRNGLAEWLAVSGWWRLAVGGWRLVVIGGCP